MKPILVVGLLWMLAPAGLRAQGLPAADSLPSLFTTLYVLPDSVPVLRLDTDWPKLIRTKMEMEYQPATLAWAGPGGREWSASVQIKTRGNMRKQVCFYPPLKIKVPKKQLQAWGMNPEFNEIKVALQCQSGGREAEWLLKEWFIYQLYQDIGTAALRTRWLKIDVRQDGKEKIVLCALLLEDEEEMAFRLGARLAKQGQMNPSVLERENYVRLCFFQYLIANTDWYIHNRHNLEFIQAPQFPGIIAIPYDFDYSGLVHTSYAVPHESLPIKSVGERHFQGFQVTETEAKQAARFFLDRKEAILYQFHHLQGLEPYSRKSLLRMADEFFYVLEDEKRLKRTFVTANR
jgi:hypothetical protein